MARSANPDSVSLFRFHHSILVAILALSAACRPDPAVAQDLGCNGCAIDVGLWPGSAQQAGHERGGAGPWWTLWSRRTPHDRALVGMFTMHVYELEDPPTNNWAFGIIRHGVLAATFITTHGPRGFVTAFERSWWEGTWGPTRTMLGFRAGLVYGYDERLFELAKHTPVLPYGQPVALIRAGPVVLDMTYTWVVFSLTAGVSFW